MLELVSYHANDRLLVAFTSAQANGRGALVVDAAILAWRPNDLHARIRQIPASACQELISDTLPPSGLGLGDPDRHENRPSRLFFCASLTNFVRGKGVVPAADVVDISSASKVAGPGAMLVKVGVA